MAAGEGGRRARVAGGERVVVFKELEEYSRPSHQPAFDVDTMDVLPYGRKEQGVVVLGFGWRWAGPKG